MTARRLARGFRVAGGVRNLPDGTVHLLAEGAPEELARFRATLEAAWPGQIEGVDEARGPARGGLEGFTIWYDRQL